MKVIKESIKKYWYLYIVGCLLGLQVLVFAIYRDNSYIQVHDNLDLFVAHYQMIGINKGWFAHDTLMPMLHGIDRDLLGSEFLLYNVLYILFPNFTAYMIGYSLKIVIGALSFYLLAKDILGEKYENYLPLIVIIAVAFGMIPVFPAYGIAFTSVPLIVLILRRLYIEGKKGILFKVEKKDIGRRALLYLAVFCYPILSYFSYHGFFILCYMCLAVLILWIRDRKFPLSIFVAICILSAGYITFEYRLFSAMLFDDTVTIRTTMKHGDLSFMEALKSGFMEFVQATFHNQDSHAYFILIVVVLAIAIVNMSYIKKREFKKIYRDPINLLFLFIVFNCLNCGFYEFAPYRELVEGLVPKLTGFEFSRTAFFNPFLWYALLLCICIRLYDASFEKNKLLANAVAVVAILVVMFVPQMYNDFYYTVYNQAYKSIKQKETSTLNYREFYSEDLFEQIKNDLDYSGEWSAAYGLHPAVLQYNGIAIIDGYLGMYPQSYKEKWTQIEKEAFEGSPSLKDYYEGWGARVCLYSANDENTYAPTRVMEPDDKRLVADMDGLKDLECDYIFSRIEISNAEEDGLELVNKYSNDNSPYTIYVYKL